MKDLNISLFSLLNIFVFLIVFYVLLILIILFTKKIKIPDYVLNSIGGIDFSILNINYVKSFFACSYDDNTKTLNILQPIKNTNNLLSFVVLVHEYSHYIDHNKHNYKIYDKFFISIMVSVNIVFIFNVIAKISSIVFDFKIFNFVQLIFIVIYSLIFINQTILLLRKEINVFLISNKLINKLMNFKLLFFIITFIDLITHIIGSLIHFILILFLCI